MPSARAFVTALLLAALAGCDMLGIESPEKVAAARDADGKAVGGACRHAGRAIEDCYALYRKADRAAIFSGWRDMNDYMRENKIEPVTPELTPGGTKAGGEKMASAKSAEKSGDTAGDDKAGDDKAMVDKAGPRMKARTEKAGKAEKADKTETADAAGKSDKADRSETGDKLEKTADKPAKSEKAAKDAGKDAES